MVSLFAAAMKQESRLKSNTQNWQAKARRAASGSAGRLDSYQHRRVVLCPGLVACPLPVTASSAARSPAVQAVERSLAVYDVP